MDAFVTKTVYQVNRYNWRGHDCKRLRENR